MLIIPELSMGGAQRSMASLSHILASAHHIWVVRFDQKHPVGYDFAGQLISLDVSTGKSAWKKGVAFLKRIKRLKKIKKELRIDVAVSFLEGADYVNLLSKAQETTMISIRGSKLHDPNIRKSFYWLRMHLLMPWLYKKADMVIAVNQGIRQEMIQHFQLHPQKVEVVENGYHIERIMMMAKELKSDSENNVYRNRVLVTSGRLAPEKGLQGIIRVFESVRMSLSNAKLVILGDGPQKTFLESLVHELKRTFAETFDEEADVYFVDPQSNIYKYLYGTHFYLMNSVSEGFPNGMVEAMICGVPVMVADCPYGPREILTKAGVGEEIGNGATRTSAGFLMPNIDDDRTVNLWANLLIETMKDDQQMIGMGKAGRLIAGDYDITNAQKKWLDLVEH
ncbi:MAG: glycosyltransferase [Cyclobacteriaceae bacterium]